MIERVSGLQIEPGLLRVFDKEPVASEPAQDPVDEAIQQTIEGLCLRRANSMESRSILLQGTDPIQNQHMQVDVQVQGGAEPLDQGDNSRSSAAAGRESCPMGQIGLDGANDNRQAAGERVRSVKNLQ